MTTLKHRAIVKVTLANVRQLERSSLTTDQQDEYDRLIAIANEIDAKERALSDQRVRPATKRDLNKSRGAVQTRFRRGTLARLDSNVVADKKSNCYDKHGVKSKASKEKRYNKSEDPAGFSNKAQGAGNVVGARDRREDATDDRNDGFYTA